MRGPVRLEGVTPARAPAAARAPCATELLVRARLRASPWRALHLGARLRRATTRAWRGTRASSARRGERRREVLRRREVRVRAHLRFVEAQLRPRRAAWARLFFVAVVASAQALRVRGGGAEDGRPPASSAAAAPPPRPARPPPRRRCARASGPAERVAVPRGASAGQSTPAVEALGGRRSPVQAAARAAARCTRSTCRRPTRPTRARRAGQAALPLFHWVVLRIACSRSPAGAAARSPWPRRRDEAAGA